MSQVLVNFRLDEEDKKGMEEVCRNLGMTLIDMLIANISINPLDIVGEKDHVLTASNFL